MENLSYKVIKNIAQYDEYCNRLEKILFSGEADNRVDEVELLTLLIETYDNQQREKDNIDPITLIKLLMDEHDMSQNELAKILGRSKSYVSEILNRKKGLSKNIIRKIADYFKISQESLNKDYDLDKAELELQN